MSEEMKNLNNEQPEETPVEKVEPQVEAKKPLDKKTIGIIAGAAAAVVVVVAIIIALALGGNNPGPSGPALNDYTLGMGVAFGEFKMPGARDGELNFTIATVVLDKDGKIVACRLDAVQNKFAVDFDNDAYNFTNLKTKRELGKNYNMATYGQDQDRNGDGKVLEWYEQAEAFEKHVVGMTVTQVENMATQTQDDGYVISADETLLSAGCTIQITEFKAAVVKACKDEQGVSFKSEGNFTLGLGANSDNYKTSVAEDVATIFMNVELAASVVEDGKIVASLNDAIQPKFVFDYYGDVTETSVDKGNGILKTKRELKEDYKMEAYGQDQDRNGDGKVLEWYKQSAAFSAYVVGMTGAQVENMATQTQDDDYIISADDALLSAGCTIQITGIKAVVAESVANAR